MAGTEIIARLRRDLPTLLREHPEVCHELWGLMLEVFLSRQEFRAFLDEMQAMREDKGFELNQRLHLASSRAVLPSLEGAEEILLSFQGYRTIVEHCRQTFADASEKKAFGVIGGCLDGKRVSVLRAVPLKRNLRQDPRFRAALDWIEEEVIPVAGLPRFNRGWVAAPEEIREVDRILDENGLMLLGSYHMHTVAGSVCTDFDKHLARDSQLWTIIVAHIEKAFPSVRAFYEGQFEREVSVLCETRRGEYSSDISQQHR